MPGQSSVAWKRSRPTHARPRHQRSANYLDNSAAVAKDQRAIGPNGWRAPHLVVHVEIPDWLAGSCVGRVHVLDSRTGVERAAVVEERGRVDRAVRAELPAFGAVGGIDGVHPAFVCTEEQRAA